MPTKEKKFTVLLEKDLHKSLKIESIERGTTLKIFVNQILKEFIKKE